ncbi:phosphorybosylanthranilate isomerase [Halobacteriales archaeon SW_5_68_122]|nr:MAG: phosphorybosylanthranilate isomerase [Halobacteriales archaeon SW_5_68_122]
MDLEATFGTPKPVVGMAHLPPLPGAPRSDGDLETVLDRAVADAEALAAGGVDGLLVENFGDAPFHPDDVPKHTVAMMTRAATAVDGAADLPVGVNILRNDAGAALSVAAAIGGAFVRVNVHAGAQVTDQGVIEGQAHETLRLRDRLDADVAVFADVNVKHSAPLGERSVREELRDICERGLADAVVVSGPATGEQVERAALGTTIEARDEVAPETPVLVGSGVTADNAADLLAAADGAIVGTALKEGGETTASVDAERVADVVSAVDAAR